MSETHLSREAHERLTKELEELTTEGRVRIARTIEAARALGDLSENGDYHAAKEEQGRMEARIRQLQAMLKTAVIVEVDAGGDEVQPGSVVTLRYEGDDDTERFLIGSMEERRDDIDIISPGSPLGAALLDGGKKGDVVEYETPTGARIKVEIVDVGR
ncbi:MAG TPA: transcription elongation factor GreA [Acidimicrobiales bacterium]|nr:transcription elongation factor GreA [Acidimicrobiales bacterium]